MSNKEKEPYATKKELAEAFEEIKNLVGGSSSSQTMATPSPEGGSHEMTEYRCRGRNCNFHTDDIGHLMLHVVEEHTPTRTPEPKPEEKPKPRHRTVDEAKGFLNCPECRKSFVEAAKGDPKFFEEIKPEEKKKRGLFH